LEWNPEKGEYCKQKGSYRVDFTAPEEYEPRELINEAADVWPMGAIIYCLLTGLWPYHEVPVKHLAKQQQLAMDGIPPYLDHQAYKMHGSFIEQRLVEIMDQCLVNDPLERVSIFQVVQHLRETRRIHRQHEQQ